MHDDLCLECCTHFLSSRCGPVWTMQSSIRCAEFSVWAMAHWKCIGVDAGRKCRSTGIELDASYTPDWRQCSDRQSNYWAWAQATTALLAPSRNWIDFTDDCQRSLDASWTIVSISNDQHAGKQDWLVAIASKKPVKYPWTFPACQSGHARTPNAQRYPHIKPYLGKFGSTTPAISGTGNYLAQYCKSTGCTTPVPTHKLFSARKKTPFFLQMQFTKKTG